MDENLKRLLEWAAPWRKSAAKCTLSAPDALLLGAGDGTAAVRIPAPEMCKLLDAKVQESGVRSQESEDD